MYGPSQLVEQHRELRYGIAWLAPWDLVYILGLWLQEPNNVAMPPKGGRSDALSNQEDLMAKLGIADKKSASYEWNGVNIENPSTTAHQGEVWQLGIKSGPAIWSILILWGVTLVKIINFNLERICFQWPNCPGISMSDSYGTDAGQNHPSC
ncbi:hypothetical protein FB451DRAFT_1163670 [Mycena latifolia]|nr:hypothetical protein FB451DRAFT_1163670 [Mycena latifolia]